MQRKESVSCGVEVTTCKELGKYLYLLCANRKGQSCMDGVGAGGQSCMDGAGAGGVELKNIYYLRSGTFVNLLNSFRPFFTLLLLTLTNQNIVLKKYTTSLIKELILTDTLGPCWRCQKQYCYSSVIDLSTNNISFEYSASLTLYCEKENNRYNQEVCSALYL